VNIQKEHVSFKALQNPAIFERIVFCPTANLYATKEEFQDCLFTINTCNEINFGWKMWQMAKAAVPEENARLSTLDAVQKLGSGDFVLVPVIDIELAIEALDEAGEGESKYYAGCADGLRKALESLEKNNGN